MKLLWSLKLSLLSPPVGGKVQLSGSVLKMLEFLGGHDRMFSSNSGLKLSQEGKRSGKFKL